MAWSKVILPMMAIGLSATISCSQQAWSWGEIGHGAIARIAEMNLTPKGRALVYSILGPEPLAAASIWPDLVRSDDRYKEFAGFHFIEIPPGQTIHMIPVNKRARSDADTIISQVPDLLLSGKYTQSQKAILLKYLIHVVGDIHQPLHVGNGVDKGGNLCDVKWTHPIHGKTLTANLHAIWDENLIQNIAAEYGRTEGASDKAKRWFGYQDLVDMILAESHSKVFVRTPPSHWYEENQKLHAMIYPDAVPVHSPKERAYCKILDPVSKKIIRGKYHESKIPVLDQHYVLKVIPIIKKQILAGGYRLASVINDAADAGRLHPLDEEADKIFLTPLLLKNSSDGAKAR